MTVPVDGASHQKQPCLPLIINSLKIYAFVKISLRNKQLIMFHIYPSIFFCQYCYCQKADHRINQADMRQIFLIYQQHKYSEDANAEYFKFQGE